MDARLIRDAPAAGAWNMAVDEVLLQAAETGPACLRFYRWSEPTVSLGYFQSVVSRQTHASSARCAWVRRATGGGAIIHDQELTYSFAVPAPARGEPSPEYLYRQVHLALIEQLVALDLPARLCEAPQRDEPFVCFQRRAVGDVLIGPHKICGSAQRRARAAVLIHGSLLLRRSAHAPELPGILDLAERPLDLAQLEHDWANAIAQRFALRLVESALQEEERRLAEELCRTRYGHPAWLERR